MTSDIVGILADLERQGRNISLDVIQSAVEQLYGDWNAITKENQQFIEAAVRKKHSKDIYEAVVEEEEQSKQLLVTFEEKATFSHQ